MINLLPPEQKQAIKFGRLNVIMMQYVVLAIIAIVILLGIVVIGAQRLSGIQNNIRDEVGADQSKVDELKGFHEQAQAISKNVNTLSNLMEQEIKFSELLTSIGRVMPQGSSLTQLSLNEDRSLPLNLTAVVTDEGTAAVLRKNLEESDIFDKADIVSITAQEDANSAYKYQVTITVVFAGANTGSPQEGDYI